MPSHWKFWMFSVQQNIISNSWRLQHNPDSKVHGANMDPTWVLSAPSGPHVGPMNLAIWEDLNITQGRWNIHTDFGFTKDDPYLMLAGMTPGAFCEHFGENSTCHSAP